MIHVISNADEVAKSIRQYAELRRKSMPDIIKHEAREMAFLLAGRSTVAAGFKGFRTAGPTPSQIEQKVVASNFKFRRKIRSDFTPTTKGFSSSAYRKAEAQLGGRKSGLFRIGRSGGIPTVRPVSAPTKRRTTKRTKGVPTSTDVKTRGGTVKRLNIISLAALHDMSGRMRAAKSGLAAVQWLPDALKARNPSNGSFTKTGLGGKVLGEARMNGTPESFVSSLTAYVPGTKVMDQKRSVVSQAFAIRNSDRDVYIRRKMDEIARKAGMKT